MGRGLATHFLLLVVAAGAAVFVWTRDKKPAVSLGDVTIWSGRPAEVSRIAFDAKSKKISLEARSDAQGRWFLGTAETPATPDAHAADAGLPAAPAAPKVVTFVSVGQTTKLVEALAPLKGVREVGRIGDDRSAEFGLKDPDGTLSVTMAGKERRLTLGGHTPGGGDRYVRDDASTLVYVVKGDVTRDLEAGEGALSERDLHEFKDGEIDSIRVVARGKSREVLRRGPESKRIWADPSDPEKADETVSNWIAKVDRLRPTEYLGGAESSVPEQVVRIDYKARGAQGAFLEIAKIPAVPPAVPPQNAPSPGSKFDFVVRSERTRQWAKVYTPVAEQVEQDLGSIVR
jgi:hypothetical protein